MALDDVLDVLKSLEIAPLPPQVKAGDRVDLRLTPPGLNAFDLLFDPPSLFDIVLNNITLDNIAIDLTDISLQPVGAPGQEGFQLTLDANNESGSAPGTTDLQLVSKAVEFKPLDPPTGTKATNINTDEESLHALPHLIGLPPAVSGAVKGLLSRITGTVGQFSGGITGNIGGHIKGRITGTINNLIGSVKAPKLSEFKPAHSVEWYIEDENGKRLIEEKNFVLLSKTLMDPAPSLMFLPVFAEPSAGVDLNSHYRIFCIVTVTVGTEKPDPRVLGPVNIVLPKIQLPTVLVMTEHAVGGANYPGAVLVAVPSHSSLLTLDQLTGKLGEVKDALDGLKTISQVVGFGETIEQINQIMFLIGPSIRIRFVKADQVSYLELVVRELHWWTYDHWQDCISSLVMIGPPGRGARFYNATDLEVHEGAFQIILGRKGVGHIDSLRPSTPTCDPPGETDPDGCTFSHLREPPPSTFNDRISSYKFLPLQ